MELRRWFDLPDIWLVAFLDRNSGGLSYTHVEVTAYNKMQAVKLARQECGQLPQAKRIFDDGAHSVVVEI